MADHITIVGLGPGDLIPEERGARRALDSDGPVLVRTLQHPAAQQLAEHKDVVSCDDLYAAEAFELVYDAIADRVLNTDGPVVYAVPGSPLVAERSVAAIRAKANAAGVPVVVVPAPSFLDEMWLALEFDPAARGMQLLDGRDMPDPIVLQLPTVVFHIDVPVVLADVVDRLARTVPDDTEVTLVTDLASPDARVETVAVGDISPDAAGLRTSLFIDVEPVGIIGALQAMRRLRVECPWDQEQTHDSLVPYMIEEAHELVEAIGHLPAGAPGGEADYGAYAEVEDELGDVLLQVLFHATLAAETGAFDFDDVAEQLRRKLIRRHPHVFADVEVRDADDVEANWSAIKDGERSRDSAMDGVPAGLPALERAWKLQKRATAVNFDWPDLSGVIGQLADEVHELATAEDDAHRRDELGDVLFSAVNAARHVGVDPELALRRATARFESRFRVVEQLAGGDVAGLSAAEALDLWAQAKRAVD